MKAILVIRTINIVIIHLALSCILQSAINAKIIPKTILFGNPEKTRPMVSPDGTQLAYCAPHDGVVTVWVASLGGCDDGTPLVTDGIRHTIYEYKWAYTNEHILYMHDGDGDENTHIYCIDIVTRKVRNLTPFPGVKANIIMLSHRCADEILVEMNKDNPALFDIYRINLIDGSYTQEVKNPGNARDWLTDRECIVRARIDTNPDKTQTLYVRDGNDMPWHSLLTVDLEQDPLVEGEYCSLVGFSSEGKHLYLITSIDAPTRRLIRMNTQTGMYEEIARDTTYDIASILFDTECGYPEIAFWEKEKPAYMPLVEDIKGDLAFIAAQISDGILDSIQRSVDKNVWVVGVNSEIRSYRYYLYRRETREICLLFCTRPQLDQYELAPLKPIAYTARDGLTIHGYLTGHATTAAQKMPLVLCVHGGPVARDVWGYNALAQFFANRGITCLQVNYRGSSGYGKKFVAAGYREWGAKMQDDLVDAVNWAIQEGIADPAKIAIFGGSYGGYAALVGVTFTPELFCCAVDFVGPSNLITLLQSIPSYWSLAQCEKLIGSLAEQEFLKSRSPLFKVDCITKPVLIVQGANDPRVKQSESEQIVAAMQKKGIPYEYLLFSDEGHGFSRPENRLKFFRTVEEFFAAHMGSLCEAKE